MKVKELIEFLLDQDCEKEIFIDAYEGGFIKLEIVREADLIKQDSYIGTHDYYKNRYDNTNPKISAIVITAFEDQF